MSHPAATSNQPDVLTAAKAVVEALSKLDKRGQGQAIRFASEVLELDAPKEARQSLKGTNSDGSTSTAGRSVLDRTPDIKSFIEAKAPRSDNQFAAVAAYFYRFEASDEEQKDSIGADELVQAARHARWPVPQRPGVTLNNAKNAGYLDGAERGRYKLNAVGENLVAITLPGDGPESNGIRKSPRRGKTAKPSAKRSVKKSPRKTVKARK